MTVVDAPTPGRSGLPRLPALRRGLAHALAEAGDGCRLGAIVGREPALHASTSPAEVVTCRLHDGTELRVFCKYSAGDAAGRGGHRGGVAYEAVVYRHVLRRWRVSTPAFYGTFPDHGTRPTGLVLEHLDEATAMHRAVDADAVIRAARWCGQFHALGETTFAARPPAVLRRYDADYYLGWARRTHALTRPFGDAFPWLGHVCEGFEQVLPSLLRAPHVVVHGEFYPGNVLVQGERIRPVDWESAAWAPGEIDLASLTDSRPPLEWPAEIVQRCEAEYARARWPRGAPPAFGPALAAARLYWPLRWLGDRPEWTRPENPYFRALRSAAERLGLL